MPVSISSVKKDSKFCLWNLFGDHACQSMLREMTQPKELLQKEGQEGLKNPGTTSVKKRKKGLRIFAACFFFLDKVFFYNTDECLIRGSFSSSKLSSKLVVLLNIIFQYFFILYKLWSKKTQVFFNVQQINVKTSKRHPIQNTQPY